VVQFVVLPNCVLLNISWEGTGRNIDWHYGDIMQGTDAYGIRLFFVAIYS
jgi:hypothetical protein